MVDPGVLIAVFAAEEMRPCVRLLRPVADACGACLRAASHAHPLRCSRAATADYTIMHACTLTFIP